MVITASGIARGPVHTTAMGTATATATATATTTTTESRNMVAKL